MFYINYFLCRKQFKLYVNKLNVKFKINNRSEKMSFDFLDLKNEFKEQEKMLRIRFYKKHPSSSKEECDKYVKQQLLRNARKLYDFQEIAEIANTSNEIGEIILFHKSINERENPETYYNELTPYWNNYNKFLDVGCGLNPAILIKFLPKDFQFYCVDKDKKILEILETLNNRFLNKKLMIIRSNLCIIPIEISKQDFDFVFIQKLIPKLTYDHNRTVLNNLAKINSKHFLLTGNKFSLSRKVSIENKERAALEQFIERYGFKKIHFFNKNNEFGWVVKK